MKTIINFGLVVSFLAIAVPGLAQNIAAPSPTPYAVVQRDGSSRIWENTTYQTSPSGRVISQVNIYKELASGLCYQQNGQWLDSKEQINILPDGSAAVTNGQHQAYFPANIYNSVIKLVTPDGLVLQSQPLGLSYDDGTNTVLIAELTNSVGQLISSNQVIYTNAFAGLNADMLYTYHKWGVEQDLVFREQPAAPEEFGMNSSNCELQMLTEFIDPPTPVAKSVYVNPPNGPQDTSLTFGKMKMIRGKAFLVGASGSQNHFPQVPVYKSWVVVNNRTLLIEQTPYQGISAQLSTLPANAVSLVSPANSILDRLSTKRLLPVARVTQESTNRVQIARANIGKMPGLMLDYVALDSAQTNYTFQGDTTYFITGPVDLYGMTTLEGGTVIKFEAGVGASLIVEDTLNCAGGPYSPSIMTAEDDNTVNVEIPGSTGSPSGSYAGNALDLEGGSPNPPIGNLRISYADTGVYSPNDVYAMNIQILNCGNAFYIYGEGSSFFENVLVANVSCAFGSYFASEATVENATVVNCSQLFGDDSDDFGINAYVYNTILANVSSQAEYEYPGDDIVFGNNNALYNSDTNSGEPLNGAITTSWPFQTVGGGSFYLTNNSPFREVGTNTIDPALLAELAQKTTWPPIVYSNFTFSAVTNFGPQIPRDTNASPDLGYHYDPIDMVFGGCVFNTNVTFTAGAALGWFEGYGPVNLSSQPYSICLNNGANWSLNGNATQPCCYANFLMVQEGENGNWDDSGFMGSIIFNGSGTAPALSANFTKWPYYSANSIMRDTANYVNDGICYFKNCEFYNLGMSQYRMESFFFTNCLFFRNNNNFWQDSPNLTFINCTFYNGCLSMYRIMPVDWTIENSAFDGTTFAYGDSYNASPTYTLFNYNSYNTNNLSWTNYPYGYSTKYGALETNAANTVWTTNYNWQSSWFGNFYLPPPADSPLIQAGSTNANLLGLYHFTTQTNQTPEGTNIVDIGYHYVATDQYGVPLDSNGDEIPDYIEDAAGNGSGNWDTTLNLNVIISQPRNGSSIP